MFLCLRVPKTHFYSFDFAGVCVCVKADLHKHSLVRCVLFVPVVLDVRHRVVRKDLMRAGK